MKHLIFLITITLALFSCEVDPVEPAPVIKTTYEKMIGSWHFLGDHWTINSKTKVDLYYFGKDFDPMTIEAMDDKIYYSGQKWIDGTYFMLDVEISLANDTTIQVTGSETRKFTNGNIWDIVALFIREHMYDPMFSMESIPIPRNWEAHTRYT